MFSPQCCKKLLVFRIPRIIVYSHLFFPQRNTIKEFVRAVDDNVDLYIFRNHTDPCRNRISIPTLRMYTKHIRNFLSSPRTAISHFHHLNIKSCGRFLNDRFTGKFCFARR